MFKKADTQMLDPREVPAIALPDRYVFPAAMDAQGRFTGFHEYIVYPGAVLTGRYWPGYRAAFLSACGHEECTHSDVVCMN